MTREERLERLAAAVVRLFDQVYNERGDLNRCFHRDFVQSVASIYPSPSDLREDAMIATIIKGREEL